MSSEHYFDRQKILFIGPRFFGYEREIVARLEQLGAVVEYHDDRPSTKASMKVAIRLFPKIVERQVRDYFEAILENAEDNFDFVFIIKLECMPLDILARLREKLKRARFIYYSWDSVRNNPNFEGAAAHFDELFTFDAEDAKRDPYLKLRPLFFLNEYRNLEKVPELYDICFVGTVHSDRYRLIRKLGEIFTQAGASMQFYMYIPHRMIYWTNRLFTPAFWRTKPSDFAFSPLKKQDLLRLIARSKAVLDIQHPGQTGLTMRTMEMVGARKKLVTTNPFVSEYDFFRRENILIVDRNKPVIAAEFISSTYVDLPTDIYEKYSLDGWIREIFSIERS